MRYFQKLIEGVDVMQLCNALARQPELWMGSLLIARVGVTDCPAMAQIPPAKARCIDLMYLLRGSQLGDVTIEKVMPGKKLPPDVLMKCTPAEKFTRYHVVLQGLPGSLFSCGDETVNMQTGEVWWFDAEAEHMVMNNSKDDRIHMLVDIRIDP